jgi:glycosyltransferase involved in cell wall biosynthesis
MPAIDLISLAENNPITAWKLGPALAVPPETRSVAGALDHLSRHSNSAGILIWDASLGWPNPVIMQHLLASSTDCWHAGLRLGLGGLPGILDFISPNWMLSCDPPSELEATSWRLSLRACLMKMETLRQLGGPRPEFQTLAAAGLEMGHRWIRRGAFMRHLPTLVECQNCTFLDRERSAACRSRLPFEDELRFAYYRHGLKWAGWALLRAWFTGYVSWPKALLAWRKVMSTSRPVEPAPLRPITTTLQPVTISTANSPVVRGPRARGPVKARVSVLIPTVDRPAYLQTLLAQLRRQTIPPAELVVVDQTAAGRSQPGLYEPFRDLPLKVIHQTEPGQCTSRNAGIQSCTGEFILLLDDDDEIPADLIEVHLRTLAEFTADVSCGVAEEVGAGPLPPDFRHVRVSDVLPANNTLLRRAVLRRSGLFDLAYNRRSRADGDLGMRLCLTGATLVLNPAISVLHHHAPAGGLRLHKARTITYAMSRRRVFCRALAGVGEFYLAERYFTPRQTRELFWHSVLGSFSLRGNRAKCAAKFLVGALLLPTTIWELRSRMARAAALAAHFPQFPELSDPRLREHSNDDADLNKPGLQAPSDASADHRQ